MAHTVTNSPVHFGIEAGHAMGPMGWWENAGKLLLIYGSMAQMSIQMMEIYGNLWGVMIRIFENWGERSPLDGQDDDKPS